MRASLFFVNISVIFSLGLAGCGAVKDVKNAENMSKEADILQDQVKAEQKALKDEEIYLDSGSVRTLDAAIFNWAEKSQEKRGELKGRLNNFVSAINRLFEIISHKDMKLTKGDVREYDLARTNAKLYLESLAKAEASGTLTAAPQPKPEEEKEKKPNSNRRPWDEDGEDEDDDE